MITTITVTTVVGLGAIISMAAVASLMIFLASRELANAGLSHFSSRIARFASVGIVPLVMAFAAIVAVKITELL